MLRTFLVLIIIHFSFYSSSQIFSPGQGVIDIEGNFYPTVILNNQEWMSRNLKTTKYNNGEVIDLIENDFTWSHTNWGSYCFYNNDQSYLDSTGLIYNFYAVIDSRNLCPVGWHVPTNNEWDDLLLFLDPNTILDWDGTQSEISGGRLKSSNSGWYLPNIGSFDSGFDAQPGGRREVIGTNTLGFNAHGSVSFYWSSSSYDTQVSYGRFMGNSVTWIKRSTFINDYGLSVRCIKNGSQSEIIELGTFELKVFPNSTYDNVNLMISENLLGETFEIYDLTGKIILTGVLNDKIQSIELTSINQGIYYFRLKNNSLEQRIIKL